MVKSRNTTPFWLHRVMRTVSAKVTAPSKEWYATIMNRRVVFAGNSFRALFLSSC